MKPKAFNVYLDYEPKIEILTNEEAGELFKAMLHYANTDEVLPMSRMAALAFIDIRKNMDTAFAAYDAMCQRNAANAKNAGRPKKSNEIEKNPVDFNGLKNSEKNNPTESKKNINNKELITNKEEIKYIVDFLNQAAGTCYKSTSEKTRTLITARLNNGFTVKDFEAVIANKVEEWQGTEFEKYLRPETLFGSKFEGYLNQKGGNRSRRTPAGIGREINEMKDDEGDEIYKQVW